MERTTQAVSADGRFTVELRVWPEGSGETWYCTDAENPDQDCWTNFPETGLTADHVLAEWVQERTS